MFIDRDGGWRSFSNGQGSMAEYLGAYLPKFLIFVEIYDLDGDLILNYPVEHCAEEGLEDSMKQQAIRYGKLIENVGICTIAVETSLVESAEWFAFEHFKAPEFLVVEALERAERYSEPGNKQLSYLDLIKEFENQKEGVEKLVAPIQEMPRPALCEHPSEFEITVLPVVMRAKSVRVKPVDDNREVDAVQGAVNSKGNAEPSAKKYPAAIPIQNEHSAAAKAAKAFAAKSRRTMSALRDITAIIYALLSWMLLILSIWAIRK